MNTYKIKARAAASTNSVKLVFTVDAEDLTKAQIEASKKLTREGRRYARIESITELGPSKKPTQDKFFLCAGLTCLETVDTEGGECPKCLLSAKSSELKTVAQHAQNAAPLLKEDSAFLKAHDELEFYGRPRPTEKCSCTNLSSGCGIIAVKYGLCTFCFEKCRKTTLP